MNLFQEILETFEELKPLLKKSSSNLANNLLGRGGNNQPEENGPHGVNNEEKVDTSILSRIQRLYNLTGQAKV